MVHRGRTVLGADGGLLAAYGAGGRAGKQAKGWSARSFWRRRSTGRSGKRRELITTRICPWPGQRQRWAPWWFLSVFSTLPVVAATPAAHAVNYVVNSLGDSVANDGVCTLREAIQEANNSADTDCPGLPSSADDRITFSVNGTIALAATLPDIVLSYLAGKLTIDGGGTVTISGSLFLRVMSVMPGADLELRNLTIANGHSEVGAILNGGTLTVANSSFSGNSGVTGGAISNFSQAVLTVRDSVFSGNSAVSSGGAIYNLGQARVVNSMFSGNRAASGGGIENAGGTLMVSHSTFSGNTASGSSAGDSGGAIRNFGTLSIVNSTFSGNAAERDGGGIANWNAARIVCSTLSGNSARQRGGGIYNARIQLQPGGIRMVLDNTIVAGSTSGGDCVNLDTLIGSHNLIEDRANACGLTNGVNGNIIGMDPRLSSLTGNPAYFPLEPGSPAIDAGDNATCAGEPVNNDSQNGVTRPRDGNGDGSSICDIGAYEAPGAGGPAPTSTPSATATPVPAPPTPTSRATPTTRCIGDCNGDGGVTIEEIIGMVNVALGSTNVSTCRSGDANGDGEITVDEIVAAVNRALTGC